MSIGMENAFVLGEDHQAVLHGKVYGHPRFVDGTVIRTNRIASIQGNIVYTDDGVYTVRCWRP